MRVAIAEDNPDFSAQLQGYLRRFGEENCQDMQVTAFSDGAELVAHYRGDYDLLLLDVDMPGLNGLDTARTVRRSDPKVLIIFITNLAQYAIHGYEVNALDYVLKPVSYYALSMKLRLALRIIRRDEEHSLLLNQDGTLVRVPLSHLYYIEIYSHQMCYHTAEGDLVQTGAKTLSSVEEELRGHGFVRCHKGLLVNLRYVDAFQGDALLLAGKRLPVSRNRKKAVLQALLEYTKGGLAQSCKE